MDYQNNLPPDAQARLDMLEDHLRKSEGVGESSEGPTDAD